MTPKSFIFGRFLFGQIYLPNWQVLGTQIFDLTWLFLFLFRPFFREAKSVKKGRKEKEKASPSGED